MFKLIKVLFAKSRYILLSEKALVDLSSVKKVKNTAANPETP